jgi:hypothetical protein
MREYFCINSFERDEMHDFLKKICKVTNSTQEVVESLDMLFILKTFEN